MTLGEPAILIFALAMLVGMVLHDRPVRFSRRQLADG
jgi:hypothetical protein